MVPWPAEGQNQAAKLNSSATCDKSCTLTEKKQLQNKDAEQCKAGNPAFNVLHPRLRKENFWDFPNLSPGAPDVSPRHG